MGKLQEIVFRENKRYNTMERDKRSDKNMDDMGKKRKEDCNPKRDKQRK